MNFVACATDRHYVEMTGVLIRSLASQTHKHPVEVIIFCTRLRAKDKAKLAACTSGSVAVSFVDLDEASLQAMTELGGTRHLSMTVYARLMIPDLLGDRLGRLIYLDCDIVLNASLDPLFALDLEGFPVAAVRNTVSARRASELNAAIGRDAEEPYFNSGVLVIDLAAWRDQHVSDRAMACARSLRGLYDADQAVLNKVLTGDWKGLDVRWNSNPKNGTADQARSMLLQHFWGRRKPHHSDYPKELREVYDRYRALTPWGTSPRISPLQRSLQKRLNALLKAYRSIANRF